MVTKHNTKSRGITMNKTIITIIATIFSLFIAACAPITPTILPNSTNMTSDMPALEMISQNQTEDMENTQTALTSTSNENIPQKIITEGETVNFPNLKATDPDGDLINYTFTSPLNKSGEWKTNIGDHGDYKMTITASDGVNTVTQDVLIIVKKKNSAPTIELNEPVKTKEGQTLTLEPDVKDEDGDEVTLTFSGWMTSKSREVEYNDSGNHRVTITATDGKEVTTKEIIIGVENVNRAPVIEEIAPVRIKEGEKVTLNPKATDADGDVLSFDFSQPFDEEGTWMTKRGDAGEYEIRVTANDAFDSAQTIFTLIVDPLNRAPTIDLESPISATEGDLITLNPIVTDPEGDALTVTYSGWMNSNTKQTGFEDAGNHKVVILAADNAGNEATLEVIINVADKNRPPVFGSGAFD